MGLSRTGCFHVVCVLVSKPYKKIHQTTKYASVVSDFRGRHANPFCTGALDAACPSQRDVKGLHCLRVKRLKHRLAWFLFWSEIQLLDRNYLAPSKVNISLLPLRISCCSYGTSAAQETHSLLTGANRATSKHIAAAIHEEQPTSNTGSALPIS